MGLALPTGEDMEKGKLKATIELAVLPLKCWEVMARNYAGTGLDSIKSKRKTKVLIHASCRVDGGKMIIKPFLVDVSSESQAGLGVFTAILGTNEVFNVTDTIASVIADKLQVPLTLEEKQKIRLSPTDSIEARTLFVKAKLFHQSLQLDSAILLLGEAIEIDSNFSGAYGYRAALLA